MQGIQPTRRPQHNLQRTLASLAVAACFLQPVLVQANPTGANVVAGSASFNTTGKTLTVTNSNNAIINWQQFNIAAGETTRFVQANANSAVLNRVVGGDLSQIYGTLQSNGQVWLINPSGILFGAGAIVDVNKLVASTLNISDANFLARNFSFSGGNALTGSLLNQGSITTPLGGSVYLIGTDVRNEGIITSPQGKVVLAAGNTVSLVDSAGPEVSVTLSANGNKAINLGMVTAQGGSINMFGALLEQQGILRADSATVDASGRIVLQATDSTTVSGALSATNSVGKGGEIQVLGDHVTLKSSASLDVSGKTGGGTVLIGGDWQGKNANIQNATTTTMEAGAVIKADATDNGNGGKVVLWSNDATYFGGNIFARGGANGGDGGQVETSGHRLQTPGQVNTLAPKGKIGDWLLDPGALCIGGPSGCTAQYDVTSWANGSSGTLSSAGDYWYSDSTLTSMLSGTNINFVASRFIFIQTTSVSLSNPGSMSFQAPLIVANGQITASGAKLDVSVNATGTWSGASAYGQNSGDVFLKAVSSNGGTLKVSADHALNLGGAIATAGGDLELIAGDVVNFGVGASSVVDLHSPTNGYWAQFLIKAPRVNLGGVVVDSTGYNTVEMDIVTNVLQGQLGAGSHLAWLGLETYTPGRSIVFGRSSTDTSVLGVTNQFANAAIREAGAYAGRCTLSSNKNCHFNTAVFDGDIVFESSSWSLSPSRSMEFAAYNIVVGAPVSMNSMVSDENSGFVLRFLAKNTFTNNYGSSALYVADASKRWGIVVGNYANSKFGGLEQQSTTQYVPWDTLVNYISNDDNNTWWAQFVGNTIINGATTTTLDIATDPCKLSPALCATTTTTTSNNNVVTTASSNATTLSSSLSIDATLTADTRYIAPAKSADSNAGPDKSGTAIVAELRTSEAKLVVKSDSDKSVQEVRGEAQQARNDAAKAEREAKRAEGEARQAESDARTAKDPAKRAEALRRAEEKKAEAELKRAEADIKRAEAEGREALAEAKQLVGDPRSAGGAGTSLVAVKRAEAEGRQASAEARRAEADAKRGEIEVKLASNSVKQARTVEQKAVAEKIVEARKSDVAAAKAEAAAKKAEAEAKQAEAEAKSASKPEQKAVAEKKAESKRAEADSKQAQADGKKAEAKAKQAESEQKEAEADAKAMKAPGAKEAASKQAEAKKADAVAGKAEADAKKIEADAKKAEADAKKAESDAQTAKTPAKKAEAEKLADAKKAEADKKQAEAKQKQDEAKQKQAEADKKHAEAKQAADKRREERRAEVARAFAAANVGRVGRDMLEALMAERHALKTEVLKPALNILERNPNAADLPTCGSGAEVCIPASAQAAKAVAAQQAAALGSQPRPTVSFLPQIERKVAVLIGINKYQDSHIPSLESAVPDTVAVAKQLNESLGYEVRVVQDASKADIVKSLANIAKEVGPNDSVAVYYAGHGYLMESTKTGYWIPADAKVTNPAQWVSNNDVSRLLAAIPAKQVMLVSDSCYSGSLTGEQKVAPLKANANPNEILAKRSVTVMSSGGEEPVSDEGKEGHSIFAWSYMNALKNVGKFEAGSKLYDQVRGEVTKEFPQTPQYGASSSAGHQAGGDYLYEKRSFR